jgi:two-component system, NarL family, response regulator NreC
VMAGKVYLSPDAATALTKALKDKPAQVEEPKLTDREIEFLKGVANGKNYKEIAQTMALSVKSVENYRARLVKKLGCSTRAELVRYAVRKGFVSA